MLAPAGLACGSDRPRSPQPPAGRPGAARTAATAEGATAVATGGVATPAPAPRARGARTRRTVLRRLAHRTVRVGHRRVRLDPSTLTCTGLGRPGWIDGAHAWTHFRCVQPTFPPGAVVGPDAIFVVSGAGSRLVVSQARFTTY